MNQLSLFHSGHVIWDSWSVNWITRIHFHHCNVTLLIFIRLRLHCIILGNIWWNQETFGYDLRSLTDMDIQPVSCCSDDFLACARSAASLSILQKTTLKLLYTFSAFSMILGLALYRRILKKFSNAWFTPYSHVAVFEYLFHSCHKRWAFLQKWGSDWILINLFQNTHCLGNVLWKVNI